MQWLINVVESAFMAVRSISLFVILRIKSILSSMAHIFGILEGGKEHIFCLFGKPHLSEELEQASKQIVDMFS